MWGCLGGFAGERVSPYRQGSGRGSVPRGGLAEVALLEVLADGLDLLTEPSELGVAGDGDVSSGSERGDGERGTIHGGGEEQEGDDARDDLGLVHGGVRSAWGCFVLP